MDTEGFHTAATLNYWRENKGLDCAMKDKELIILPQAADEPAGWTIALQVPF